MRGSSTLATAERHQKPVLPSSHASLWAPLTSPAYSSLACSASAVAPVPLPRWRCPPAHPRINPRLTRAPPTRPAIHSPSRLSGSHRLAASTTMVPSASRRCPGARAGGVVRRRRPSGRLPTCRVTDRSGTFAARPTTSQTSSSGTRAGGYAIRVLQPRALRSSPDAVPSHPPAMPCPPTRHARLASQRYLQNTVNSDITELFEAHHVGYTAAKTLGQFRVGAAQGRAAPRRPHGGHASVRFRALKAHVAASFDLGALKEPAYEYTLLSRATLGTPPPPLPAAAAAASRPTGRPKPAPVHARHQQRTLASLHLARPPAGLHRRAPRPLRRLPARAVGRRGVALPLGPRCESGLRCRRPA